MFCGLAVSAARILGQNEKSWDIMHWEWSALYRKHYSPPSSFNVDFPFDEASNKIYLDRTASETFFGWINAVYSLGQAVMCPVFGYWCTRVGSCRTPILFGITLMSIGNMIYLLCDISLFDPKWVMFVSRALMGVGAGVVTVLRTYAVNGSTPKDRSRSISLSMGSFALGLTFGPSIQAFFTPLDYPGIYLFSGISINMYTASAFMGIVFNGMCALLVIFVFRESNIGIHRSIQTENESHQRFYALPSYDKFAVAICIMTRFAQMFVITNLETIGSPFAMTMFNWNKRETVMYSSFMHGGFGLVGLIIYALNVSFDFGSKINHRITTCVGMGLLVLFHLLSFPWWFLTGKITYQETYIEINGTTILNPDPVGCRPTYQWCEDVPTIDPIVYIASYIFVCGTAFCLINVSMNTVFSTILGPRDQGTLQGILLLSGSFARMCGPIFVSSLFEEYGPRLPWILEIIFLTIGTTLWIVHYDRMIPLQTTEKMPTGSSFKNKHGWVYKF